MSQQIAYIPASMSQGDKQTTAFTYSIYVLLGAISEIIKVYKIDKNEVGKSIQQMSQIRAYPMPNGMFSDEREKEEIEFSTDDSVIIAEGKGDSCELANLIIKWLEMMDSKLIVSPHVLGKISTRLFYTIKSIEASVKSENVGEAMHRRVIAILNSILIEDMKENIRENLNISNNNPVSVDDLFIGNLKKANSKDDILKILIFSRWMLSCPLLLLYLDYRKLEFKEELAKYSLNKDFCEQLFNKSIYDTLLEVKVRDKFEKTIVKSLFNPNKKDNGVNQTIAVVSKYMDRDTFISMEYHELIARLKQYFTGSITEASINKARKYIIDNNKQW